MSKVNRKSDFVEKLRESTGVIGVACKKIGISRETFYDWLKKDPKFAEEAKESLKEGKTKRLDIALSHHVLKLQEGSDKAVYFELDRRHPDYKQKLDITGRTPFFLGDKHDRKREGTN